MSTERSSIEPAARRQQRVHAVMTGYQSVLQEGVTVKGLHRLALAERALLDGRRSTPTEGHDTPSIDSRSTASRGPRQIPLASYNASPSPQRPALPIGARLYRLRVGEEQPPFGVHTRDAEGGGVALVQVKGAAHKAGIRLRPPPHVDYVWGVNGSRVSSVAEMESAMRRAAGAGEFAVALVSAPRASSTGASRSPSISNRGAAAAAAPPGPSGLSEPRAGSRSGDSPGVPQPLSPDGAPGSARPSPIFPPANPERRVSAGANSAGPSLVGWDPAASFPRRADYPDTGSNLGETARQVTGELLPDAQNDKALSALEHRAAALEHSGALGSSAGRELAELRGQLQQARAAEESAKFATLAAKLHSTKEALAVAEERHRTARARQAELEAELAEAKEKGEPEHSESLRQEMASVLAARDSETEALRVSLAVIENQLAGSRSITQGGEAAEDSGNVSARAELALVEGRAERLRLQLGASESEKRAAEDRAAALQRQLRAAKEALVVHTAWHQNTRATAKARYAVLEEKLEHAKAGGSEAERLRLESELAALAGGSPPMSPVSGAKAGMLGRTIQGLQEELVVLSAASPLGKALESHSGKNSKRSGGLSSLLKAQIMENVDAGDTAAPPTPADGAPKSSSAEAGDPATGGGSEDRLAGNAELTFLDAKAARLRARMSEALMGGGSDKAALEEELRTARQALVAAELRTKNALAAAEARQAELQAQLERER
eukprot:Hpha_TRINITY_DN15812_c0_g4::TRINITY_DN15812_c0_g4_i5::g.188723::m.188723